MKNSVLIYLTTFIAMYFTIPIPANAVYIYKTIKPGTTTIDEVTDIFGDPLEEVGSQIYKYKSTQEGIDEYIVEYKTNDSNLIVERLNLVFNKPYKSKPLAKAMKLPDPTSTGLSKEGKYEEYFGSKYSVVFVHKSDSPKSGVVIMSIYNPMLFDTLVGDKDDAQSTEQTGREESSEVSSIEREQQEQAAKKITEAKRHMQQGMIYVSIGKANPETRSENYNNALFEFDKAIELNPNYAEAYSDRGVVYMQQKKYNKAEENLKKALEIKPKDPIILYNLAALYSLQKKNDIALEYLDQALEKGFDNFDALKAKGKNSDSDLANLRKDPEYKKVLEKHKVFIMK